MHLSETQQLHSFILDFSGRFDMFLYPLLGLFHILKRVIFQQMLWFSRRLLSFLNFLTSSLLEYQGINYQYDILAHVLVVVVPKPYLINYFTNMERSLFFFWVTVYLFSVLVGRLAS